ncbi:hypothetical protein BCT07_18130 [Vibrio breoganii]|uniref:hypothetical protein n=1 Tax=Vibrio breoganii TaxID=553239 RepID=UPI000C8612FB|nr:hypothetical protein [Vibrio breoganii]PMO52711.1 hypothetical protein BCT07_18130 [Vibrio breoganii]
MSSLSVWEDIKKIVVNSESRDLLQALESSSSEYGNWYQYVKTSSFGNITPQEAVALHGKQYLIRYLDHKVLGGYE